MIPRNRYISLLKKAIGRSPATALLGPRQCGKTTLARLLMKEFKTHYLDLESPADLARLQNPQLFLEPLEGLVVIDEIQLRPDLFPLLRVLADRENKPARFLILGSASPSLQKHASDSLAGRLEFIDIAGFGLEEVGGESAEKLWLRGGFPRSFLAGTNEDSLAWRENFIRTFLQKDIPQFGISIPEPALRRFWTMLAHYHGQILNTSELGRALGISDKTVRRYLDILTQTFMVRQLQPWYENTSKRQVKSPKIYLRDSGLFHSLMNIPDKKTLWGHPKIGASWEGFMLEQLLRNIPGDAYFWAAHSGGEIDLVIISRGRKFGVEFKWSEKPSATRSLHSAKNELSIEKVWLVYPGKESFPLAEDMEVLPVSALGEIPAALTKARP